VLEENVVACLEVILSQKLKIKQLNIFISIMTISLPKSGTESTLDKKLLLNIHRANKQCGI
jgi:hypothetical protein